jgi:hypothetical protein
MAKLVVRNLEQSVKTKLIFRIYLSQSSTLPREAVLLPQSTCAERFL